MARAKPRPYNATWAATRGLGVDHVSSRHQRCDGAGRQCGGPTDLLRHQPVQLGVFAGRVNSTVWATRQLLSVQMVPLVNPDLSIRPTVSGFGGPPRGPPDRDQTQSASMANRQKKPRNGRVGPHRRARTRRATAPDRLDSGPPNVTGQAADDRARIVYRDWLVPARQLCGQSAVQTGGLRVVSTSSRPPALTDRRYVGQSMWTRRYEPAFSTAEAFSATGRSVVCRAPNQTKCKTVPRLRPTPQDTLARKGRG